MRVFDILACRGFVLAAHSDALAELFDIGSEVDSWRTAEELEEKVAWYLKNPDTAISIAKRGHERVLKDHTIQIRLRKMLEPK
jgi:spore maturation protein CgeB